MTASILRTIFIYQLEEYYRILNTIKDCLAVSLIKGSFCDVIRAELKISDTQENLSICSLQIELVNTLASLTSAKVSI